jgi:hypothetical protein
MTVRTQYAVPTPVVSVTGATVFNINRPRTLPVDTNTIDFVARGYTRQEFEGGLAVLELSALAKAAGVIAVRAIEIIDFGGNVARTVLSTTGNVYTGDLSITTDLLARLMIREDDAGIRVTLISVGGGAIAGCGITGRFDFGLNNANYGSNQGL